MALGFGALLVAAVAGLAGLAGGAHLLHQGFGALRKIVASALAGVDHDEQLARPGRFGAGVLRPVKVKREVAARERRSQQLDHHRQGRSLVAAKRQQRTAVQDGGRVAGGLAVAVHAVALGQGVARARGNLHVAVGDGAGGEVKHQRVAPCARRGKGDGVGAKQGLVPTRGHHAGHAVHEGQRHQPFAGKGLHVGPERGEMVRVADGQQRNAVAARLVDQQAACSLQGGLCKTVAGIHRHVAGCHVLHLRHGLPIDPAAGQRGKVARDAEDAMAFGAVALGAGAVGGQHGRHFGRGAVAQKDLGEQGLQLGAGNQRSAGAVGHVRGRCGHVYLLCFI